VHIIARFEVGTDLTKSHRDYTDLIAEKGSEDLRIEIEYHISKEQIEKSIRKPLNTQILSM